MKLRLPKIGKGWASALRGIATIGGGLLGGPAGAALVGGLAGNIGKGKLKSVGDVLKNSAIGAASGAVTGGGGANFLKEGLKAGGKAVAKQGVSGLVKAGAKGALKNTDKILAVGAALEGMKANKRAAELEREALAGYDGMANSLDLAALQGAPVDYTAGLVDPRNPFAGGR